MVLTTATWLLLLLAAAAAVLSVRKPTEASHGEIAVLSGIWANVWNAECYYPPLWAPCGAAGPHSGGNTPFDIGNGNPDHWIFAQLDYLPTNVSGGWMQDWNISSACADKTGAEWNGRKLYVKIYFYDTAGNIITWIHAIYQHVGNERISSIATWNNPYSTDPYWWDPDYTLNNLRLGGILVADVAQLGSSPSPGCSTNEHLHMEGNAYSRYNTARYYLEPVTDRVDDIFYYHQPLINGTY
ncbi:MAG: hypothetical protein GEU80_10240 [Dehalococcoidia bacterium]|nr:hypothetical protein [Dehalococcoidia bacterium]